MNGITWKFRANMNCWSGYTDPKKTTLDDDAAFSIEGRYCVTDVRETKASKEPILPKSYLISSIEEGKKIAEDLHNGINLEKHQANYEAMEAKSQKTVDVISEATDLLKSIQDGTYEAPKNYIYIVISNRFGLISLIGSWRNEDDAKDAKAIQESLDTKATIYIVESELK